MSEIFQVADLKTALQLARKFKESGKYNLFRGQAQNWPVMSSLGRLLPNPDPEIRKRVERLFLFFDSNPGLKKYKSDIDWFWAVAQHYGLPTNYIDFTSDPAVAAYFATNSKANVVGQESVIVCLNESDWIVFMSGLEDYFKEEQVIVPYIKHVDVDNLWRLQAQHGCFMFSPYNNIEFFYDFDRIVFPYSERYAAIRSGHIYPKRKSELEQLLDHFFNMEERIEGSERLRKFALSVNIPITQVGALEYKHYFKGKKKHPSWRSAEFKARDFPLIERWESDKKGIQLRLEFNPGISADIQIKILQEQITDLFKKRKINRKTDIKFYLSSKSTLSRKDIRLINRSCARAWNGTRNLPFSDMEIIQLISQTIVSGMTKQLTEKTLSFSGEELLLLEMTNEYGNSTKCRVSPSVILAAFRSDLLDVLVDDAPKVLQPEILLHINNPFLLFDFHLLLDAFKKEMICYQILRQRENDNPVIFFTPAQINILGYA